MCLHCSDSCTQPLQYRVNENGKYEIVLFDEIRGMGMCGDEYHLYIEDEFEELLTTQSNENQSFVCLRKGNAWGMYKYWWSEESDKEEANAALFGCVFEQVEDFKWQSLRTMLKAYDLVIEIREEDAIGKELNSIEIMEDDMI